LGHFVLARLAKFVKTLKKHYFVILASHIFLKNGYWEMSASPASTCQTAWRMLASLMCLSKLLGECSEFGESAKTSEKGHFGECK
jgi:hypothetical protein